jgi:hypothetical protein
MFAGSPQGAASTSPLGAGGHHYPAVPPPLNPPLHGMHRPVGINSRLSASGGARSAAAADAAAHAGDHAPSPSEYTAGAGFSSPRNTRRSPGTLAVVLPDPAGVTRRPHPGRSAAHPGGPGSPGGLSRLAGGQSANGGVGGHSWSGGPSAELELHLQETLQDVRTNAMVSTIRKMLRSTLVHQLVPKQQL